MEVAARCATAVVKNCGGSGAWRNVTPSGRQSAGSCARGRRRRPAATRAATAARGRPSARSGGGGRGGGAARPRRGADEDGGGLHRVAQDGAAGLLYRKSGESRSGASRARRSVAKAAARERPPTMHRAARRRLEPAAGRKRERRRRERHRHVLAPSELERRTDAFEDCVEIRMTQPTTRCAKVYTVAIPVARGLQEVSDNDAATFRITFGAEPTQIRDQDFPQTNQMVRPGVEGGGTPFFVCERQSKHQPSAHGGRASPCARRRLGLRRRVVRAHQGRSRSRRARLPADASPSQDRTDADPGADAATCRGVCDGVRAARTHAAASGVNPSPATAGDSRVDGLVTRGLASARTTRTMPPSARRRARVFGRAPSRRPREAQFLGIERLRRTSSCDTLAGFATPVACDGCSTHPPIGRMETGGRPHGGLAVGTPLARATWLDASPDDGNRWEKVRTPPWRNGARRCKLVPQMADIALLVRRGEAAPPNGLGAWLPESAAWPAVLGEDSIRAGRVRRNRAIRDVARAREL